MATLPSPHTYAVGEVDTAANENSQTTAINFLLGGAAGRKPTVKVRLATAISIANGATTTLKWDTVDEDTDSGIGGGYSATTGLYTVGTAGLWLFTASSAWAASTVGNRGLGFVQNGADQADSFYPANVDPGSTGRGSVSRLLRCAVNDTVGVTVYQNSGAALNFASGAPGGFVGVWLGQ